MDKKTYFPNSPFFLFESVILLVVISIIVITINSSSIASNLKIFNPVNYFLIVPGIFLIVIIYFSNRIEINSDFIKGPSNSHFIIFSTQIPIKEAEYHFEEKFFRYMGMVKFLVVRHRDSHKKIYISCLAHTNETIEEIIRILGEESLK